MQIQVADQALRRFQRSGAVSSDVPTPHRLAKAAGSAHIEKTVRTVDIVQDGEATSVAVTGHRVRLTDSPFETLVRRKQLAPGNLELNRILTAAARRYHSIWRQAGLEPICGQDPSKIPSTASNAGLIGTEKKSNAFKEYCAASDALHRLDRLAVDAIVLNERRPEDIGQKLCAVRDRTLTIGIATHRLRSGLHELAIHFGLLVDEPEPAVP